MRVGPRSLQIVAMIGIAAAAVVAACGDDDDGNATVPPATDGGNDSTTGFDGGGGGDSSTTQDSSTFTDAPVADSEPGFLFDAGPPITLDGGPDSAGIPCTQGGIAETESNNTPQTANTLPNAALGTPATICGILTPGDGGQDIEYVAFKLSAATQSFDVQWSGAIVQPPTVTVDGGPVTIGAAGSFQKTDPYVFKIEPQNTSGTAPLPWRLSIKEK